MMRRQVQRTLGGYVGELTEAPRYSGGGGRLVRITIAPSRARGPNRSIAVAPLRTSISSMSSGATSGSGERSPRPLSADWYTMRSPATELGSYTTPSITKAGLPVVGPVWPRMRSHPSGRTVTCCPESMARIADACGASGACDASEDERARLAQAPRPHIAVMSHSARRISLCTSRSMPRAMKPSVNHYR